jgi:hypothetical protein
MRPCISASALSVEKGGLGYLGGRKGKYCSVSSQALALLLILSNHHSELALSRHAWKPGPNEALTIEDLRKKKSKGQAF